VTNLHQLTSQSTTSCHTTWRSYHRLLWRHFTLSIINLCVADHVAIPTKAGAMENWGLVTYGEDFLLTHPETSSASGYYRVASVVAHELAHQVGYDSSVDRIW